VYSYHVEKSKHIIDPCSTTWWKKLVTELSITVVGNVKSKTVSQITDLGSGTIFTKLHFLHYLQMGEISKKVTFHLAGKVCQGQTL
jgi:hypothetical protein